MKRLSILRHADAEPPRDGVRDFDRPLSGRGRLNALRVGRAMAERDEHPALVLCSTAARARETLERIDDVVFHAVRRFDEELYLAPLPMLHERLREIEEGFTSVLLVGHNPGLASLIGFLAGTATATAEARIGAGLPPGGMAVLEFDGENTPWSAIDAGACRLTDLRLPGDPIRPA